jgi:hypothetical protein
MTKDAQIYEFTESHDALYTEISDLPEERLHRPNATRYYSH